MAHIASPNAVTCVKKDQKFMPTPAGRHPSPHPMLPWQMSCSLSRMQAILLSFSSPWTASTNAKTCRSVRQNVYIQSETSTSCLLRRGEPPAANTHVKVTFCTPRDSTFQTPRRSVFSYMQVKTLGRPSPWATTLDSRPAES